MNAARIGRFFRNVVTGLAMLGAGLVGAGAEAPARSKTLALVGGRIVTQTDAGTITGTIVIRDGSIVAVGPQVTIPADAERIDISGLTVTPGLIDARSTLGVHPDALHDGGNDAGLDILDGIDSHEEDWKEVSRQGVTAVYVQPARSGILGGKGAVLRVGPAESVQEMVVKAGAGLQSAPGARPSAAAPVVQQRVGRRGRPDGQPVAAPAQPAGPQNQPSRAGQYAQIRRVLESAKPYDETWKKYEATTKSAKGKPPAKGATEPKRDATKDFLRKVLHGEVPLRLEARSESDIRFALRLADDLKLRLVLDGVESPGAAAKSVAERRVPLVLGPFANAEGSASQKHGAGNWPHQLLAPETRWALGTFSSQPRGSRFLRVHAAAAIARGLDPDRVLRAMTRDAAELLGVSDRLGSVAVGKQADLAVFAGDPLDPAVPVQLTLSAGNIVYRAPKPVTPDRAITTAQRVGPPKDALPAKLPAQYALKTKRLASENGRLRPGMVLINGGRVTAVGPLVMVPAGIPTFDVGSAVITPGLVLGQSHLGFADAIDDAAEADTAQVRAGDVFNPQNRIVRELLEAGFTRALFVPGSSNVLAGTACDVRLGADGPSDVDAALKFVLAASSRTASRPPPAPSPDDQPVVAFQRSRGPSRYPASLAGQVELVEQVLSGKAPASDLYVPSKIRRQLEQERGRHVAAVLERKQVALFEANTRAEIAAALQLIDRFKLRAVLVGPEEIKPFIPDIKRLGVGIVAHPIHADDYDRPAVELAEAASAGVPVAFEGTSAEAVRQTAALAVNAGMSREAAWRGVTTAATHMTGLPANAGRLVVDGPADWVLWDGPPLDLRSRPLRVVVGGKLLYSALTNVQAPVRKNDQ